MSDPCPGLSVRIGERKSDGPSGKFLQKSVNIGARTANYDISVDPGVPFGIVVKVKEDFDFKGSEGLRITIVIHDRGGDNYRGLTRPSRHSQSWYVDAMSKWRGRQVFHTFDESTTPAEPIPRAREFSMPRPSNVREFADDFGVVTVRVERGNLVPGNSPTQTKLSPEEYRRRSSKQMIKPGQQFRGILETWECYEVAAEYKFRNTATVETTTPSGNIEKPQLSEDKGEASSMQTWTPIQREYSNTIGTTHTATPESWMNFGTVGGDSSPFPARLTKEKEDIDALKRSQLDLLRAVEKLTVAPMASADEPLLKNDTVTAGSDKSSHHTLCGKPRKPREETTAAGLTPRTTGRGLHRVLTTECETGVIRCYDVFPKKQKGSMQHNRSTEHPRNKAIHTRPAPPLPAQYARYGEIKQETGKEDHAEHELSKDEDKDSAGIIDKSGYSRTDVIDLLRFTGPSFFDDKAPRFQKVKDTDMEEEKISSIKKGKACNIKKTEAMGLSVDAKLSFNEGKTSITHKDKDTNINDDTTSSIEKAMSPRIANTDDASTEDDDYIMVDEPVADDYVMVDEPVANGPESGGCVCS